MSDVSKTNELIARARGVLGRINTNTFDHDLLFQYRGAVLRRELTLIVRDLADALEAVRAERDAALAAIERVREIHVRDTPSIGGDWCLDDHHKWPCPTIQALDGAPEPEWEWGYRGETLIDVHARKSRESAEGAVKDLTEYWAPQGKKFEVVRRRKSGPWLPVPCGEGDGE